MRARNSVKGTMILYRPISLAPLPLFRSLGFTERKVLNFEERECSSCLNVYESRQRWILAMRYRVLGRTGLKMSALSCGTNRLRMKTQENADVVLNYALDRGINFIETGRPYGPTEEMVGKAVSNRREEYRIAAKTVLFSREEVEREVDLSLQALRTDYMDIYEIIFGREEDLQKILGEDGALQALLEAKEEGKIGFIGVGGHRPELLAQALKTGHFDTVLFHFNMVQLRALNELIPIAREVGAGTLVMRPIGHGALAPVSRTLRFPLSCPGVDVVLCGMYSTSEIDENMAISEAEPTQEEWKSLLAEAEALENTGCTLCGYCSACPKKISIGSIMTLIRYRQKHSLLPESEAQWRSYAEKAKMCDECGLCEEKCPYSLSIVPVIREASLS